jgi:hypothetical protein
MANGNTFQDFAPGYWGDVLRQFEPAQYYSSPTGLGFGSIQAGAGGGAAGMAPRRRRFFESSYDDILRDYYGAAGTSLRKGQAPQTFMQFMKTNPWTTRYAQLPQYERGMTGSAANPRTRFLFNY